MAYAMVYLTFVLIVMVFQVMITDGEVIDVAFTEPGEGTLGGLDILGDLVNLALGFARTLWNLATFNIGTDEDPAPTLVRFLWGGFNTGSLAYIISSFVRGTKA